LRRLLVSYFFAVSLRCQASSVAGVTEKIPPARGKRRRGISRASAAIQARSGALVPHPAGVPAQHRVLVPQHQQPGIPGLIPAKRQDSKAQ